MPKIIAMSGKLTDGQLQGLKTTGFDGFLKKPFQLRQVVEKQAATSPVRFPFSAMNPGLQNPYAIHYQFNVQRAITSTLMVESGYVGNRGVKFILHRVPNLPDRTLPATRSMRSTRQVLSAFLCSDDAGRTRLR